MLLRRVAAAALDGAGLVPPVGGGEPRRHLNLRARHRPAAGGASARRGRPVMTERWVQGQSMPGAAAAAEHMANSSRSAKLACEARVTSAAPRLRLGCWRQAGGGNGTQRPLVDAAVQLRCAGTLAMALRGAIGDTGSPAEPLQSRRAGRRGNRARRAAGLLQSMPAGNGRCRSVDRACSLGGTAGQQATPRAKLRAQCPCEPIACFNTLVGYHTVLLAAPPPYWPL